MCMKPQEALTGIKYCVCLRTCVHMKVPSELMEFFCGHEDVLALIADNKDPELIQSLAAKLQAKQQLFQALELQEQVRS